MTDLTKPSAPKTHAELIEQDLIALRARKNELRARLEQWLAGLISNGEYLSFISEEICCREAAEFARFEQMLETE